MMGSTEHPNGHRHTGGIAHCLRDGFTALGQQQRAADVPDSGQEDIQSAKQAKLMKKIFETFSDFQPSRKGAAYLLTIALRKHQRTVWSSISRRVPRVVSSSAAIARS